MPKFSTGRLAPTHGEQSYPIFLLTVQRVQLLSNLFFVAIFVFPKNRCNLFTVLSRSFIHFVNRYTLNFRKQAELKTIILAACTLIYNAQKFEISVIFVSTTICCLFLHRGLCQIVLVFFTQKFECGSIKVVQVVFECRCNFPILQELNCDVKWELSIRFWSDQELLVALSRHYCICQMKTLIFTYKGKFDKSVPQIIRVQTTQGGGDITVLGI